MCAIMFMFTAPMRFALSESLAENDQNQHLESDRIATLADGVFAIVLTLLVIDLKAPEAVSSSELIEHLVALGPKFLSYALTFGVVSIFWFGHHMEFHYIRRSDRTHLWINLLFMMAISFLPFSASLLGNNLTQPLANAFYGIHLSILGFIRYWHWRYVTDDHRLIDNSVSRDLIHEVSGTFLWVACGYLIASAVSFFSVYASLLFYAALALRYVFSAKADRHLTSVKVAKPVSSVETIVSGGTEPSINGASINSAKAQDDAGSSFLDDLPPPSQVDTKRQSI